jgi:branched-chain amino acid transport system substrate-binding protein
MLTLQGILKRGYMVVRKPWIVASIIAVCGIVLAAVWYVNYTESRQPETGTIRVGAIAPLTGPFAAYGEPVRDGMQLAVEEINAAGGIIGRRLELVLEDDAGDPKSAVNAFIKLATLSKVPVVVGPLSSGASMAVAPLAERYHVVELATLAGTIDLTHAGDYVFRIYPSSEVGSRYIAKIAVERFKAKRIAILYPNNAFGVSSRRFVTEVAKRAGAEIVDVETYNDGDRDFRTQLTKIAASKPDVILSSAYYEDGAQILVQARQLGLDVPILGEDGWFGPIAQIAGDTLTNLYFANVAFGPEYQDNHTMQNFIVAFRKRFGRSPNSYSAAGYAAVYVVKHAIEVGGYDGPGIKEALYHTDMETAFGRVRYDENGDNVGATYDLYQLNESNEPVLVRQHAGG